MAPAEIAERNAILLVTVGSGVHGVALEGTDDHDEMGICRTQPEGARSGPGDTALVGFLHKRGKRVIRRERPANEICDRALRVRCGLLREQPVAVDDGDVDELAISPARLLVQHLECDRLVYELALHEDALPRGSPPDHLGGLLRAKKQ